MRIIALDLGIKSCGIAISDPFNMFAIALENYIFSENDFPSLINHLKQIFQEYEIQKIILGYPLRMTGTKSQTTLMIEEFKILLEENFKQEIILFDERLTTKKAMTHLKNANLSTSKAKQHKDVIAATLMLNEYLNNY
ncbi:Holliday junction resolvase RuvX [Mycoplasmopsis agassizii]|uniref:Putative pre-16S rRNA nuclease n=1 Tax=Mycoplasmopsis agassizii TaxID=33922 RepID=A0ABX4H464_9BACT|nr:Holliday junction resolvase RuvX [Mycoplasmopsis agassizii]PAF54676.1 Holliday junction resolvase RuvX [Mycoplasmopsis agassizii]SMC16082.1 putative holliday junction resolvase [Mycoplasmopsis agassizii]